ncbi:MAG: hypothetical protein R3D88_04100 [Alphaproteobacteria bacterium]|nr:hypothetical protein [Alphaproteobacteria bacterium]
MFQRNLTEEEISQALERGDKRAYTLIKDAPLSKLNEAFERVALSTQACLDNFDKSLFLGRENHKKSEVVLKAMILGAFSGVATLERIEDEIDRQSNVSMFKRQSNALHMALLKAVNVYKTNGESDDVALDAESTIARYHHNHPLCAA